MSQTEGETFTLSSIPVMARRYHNELQDRETEPVGRLRRLKHRLDALNFASLLFLEWSAGNTTTYEDETRYFESDEYKTKWWFIEMGLAIPALLYSEFKLVDQIVEGVTHGGIEHPMKVVGTAALGLFSYALIRANLSEGMTDGVLNILDRPVSAVLRFMDRHNLSK